MVITTTTTTTISIIRELKGIGGKSGKIPRLVRQVIPVVIGSFGLPFQECSSIVCVVDESHRGENANCRFSLSRHQNKNRKPFDE